ncbi:MAG: hypothetical protein ACR2JL_02675 [Candidatus Limnocylindrus sp.]
MNRFQRHRARMGAALVAMALLSTTFAGSAYAAAATVTTKGTVPGGSASAAPSATWSGDSFDVALSMVTNSTNPAKSYLVVSGNCEMNGAEAVTINGAGDCVVTGISASDGTLTTGTDDMTIAVAKGTPVITFAQPSAQTVGTDLTLVGSIDVDGLSIAWSKTSGAGCSIASNIVSFTTNANCVIKAAYDGSSNNDWNSAIDVSRTITVGLGTQAILGFVDDTVTSSTYTLSDTVTTPTSGGGAVTWAASPAEVCTVAAGIVTRVASGACSVTATVATVANKWVETTINKTITFVIKPTTTAAPVMSRDRRGNFSVAAHNFQANGGSLTLSYKWYVCKNTHLGASAVDTLVVPADCQLVSSNSTASSVNLRGHKGNNVRLMVQGSNLAGSKYAWSATMKK